MKALVLIGARDIELRDLPIPRPGPGQVLVRHIATAISTGSEVIRYLKGAGPDIGYLGAGIVEDVGEGVTELQPGDRVRDGGPHHEYVVVPAGSVLKIPEGLDYAQGAYSYLPTLGLHALRLCDYRLGENAAIIGMGVVGLMSSAMAEAMGIPVIALDTDETRLEVARKMKVSHPLNPAAADFAAQLQQVVGDKGVDVTVDATGSYNGLIQAMYMTRRWGRIAILGMYRPDPPSPDMTARLYEAYTKNLHGKELRLVGCSNDPHEDYPAHIWRFSIYDNMRLSIALLGQGKYTLTPAITHRLPPEEGLTLYERLGSAELRPANTLGIIYEWS